jgi:phosphoglycolate phosphatase-like HAD superfamily hydrolase
MPVKACHMRNSVQQSWVDDYVQGICHRRISMLPSPAQVLGDLQELGVELLAVSGDPRERAESFVRPLSLFALLLLS